MDERVLKYHQSVGGREPAADTHGNSRSRAVRLPDHRTHGFGNVHRFKAFVRALPGRVGERAQARALDTLLPGRQRDAEGNTCGSGLGPEFVERQPANCAGCAAFAAGAGNGFGRIMQTPMPKLKVLFLCTGNSCRSQMAEGWSRALKSDLLEPYSAGIEKHGLN